MKKKLEKEAYNRLFKDYVISNSLKREITTILQFKKE